MGNTSSKPRKSMQAGISKGDEQHWHVCIHHRACHEVTHFFKYDCNIVHYCTICTIFYFILLKTEIFHDFFWNIHLAAPCGYLLFDLQGDDGPAMRADAAAFLPGKGYVKETPEVHSHDT